MERIATAGRCTDCVEATDRPRAVRPVPAVLTAAGLDARRGAAISGLLARQNQTGDNQ